MESCQATRIPELRATITRRLSVLGILRGRAWNPSFAKEVNRLRSFNGFPSRCAVRPADLAKAGFFFTGCGDHVRCFYCGCGLRWWKEDDQPFEEHARFFPTCNNLIACKGEAFIKRVQEKYNRTTQSSNVIDLTAPLSPKFASLSERQKSYCHRGFPANCPMDVIDLANSGFFYTGYSDHVSCFNCLLTLGTWVQTDNAWERHARWSSGCCYLIDMKGEAFVKEIQQRHDMQVEVATLSLMGVHLQAPREQDSEVVDEREEPEQEAISVTEQRPDAEATGDGDCIKEEKIQEMFSCKVCLINETEVVFLPCGHAVACMQCNNLLKTCPICRKCVKAIARIYLS